MKNIIAVILLVFFVNSTVYANVYRYPESPYDCQPTQFYIDYNIDKFNDIQFNDPYLINRTYGTFSNEYIGLNN